MKGKKREKNITDIPHDEVYIIAEIGKNFINTEDEQSIESYLENATKLVKAAKESGADAVKFQTHEIEDEVLNIDFTSPHFTAKDRYSWVTRNTNVTPLETFWKPLKKYCDECDITFFSTPMSRKAAKKLDQAGVPMWKVGSGDVQDYVMLDYLIESKKPIIISTGMVNHDELDEIVEYINKGGSPLVILYCISKYPCPSEYFNLATIERFKERYPHAIIGFSDHSITHDAALRAVKLGAQVLEKHFSFSRDLWGADHKASITPDEMKELVDFVQEKKYKDLAIESFYGEKDKELEGANNQFRPYFNKALVAGEDIKKGRVLTRDMVYAMRPIMYAKGLPAHELPNILGKKTTRNLKKYDPITREVLTTE